VSERLVAVLDVGKTLAKLSLWTPRGEPVAKASRPNLRIEADGYRALDVDGVDAWIAETLTDFAKRGDIGAIVPVSHGAAAAIIKDGALACPPMDYESAIPAEVRADYERRRDAFAATGSPARPAGRTLGARPSPLRRPGRAASAGAAQILPWARYGAGRLSGGARSEVTSLGCHTDLWRPAEARPSSLAEALGWADRFAPLAAAGDVIGVITPDWAARTGLPADVQIYCGLHDSNAALLAARGFPEIADGDSTVLSTGTWFVAMRRPDGVDALPVLTEARDCLLNVDAFGAQTPSSRFMGGREIEILSGVDPQRIDIKPDQPKLVAALPQILADGARVLPTFAPGFGPFPQGEGRWVNRPDDPYAWRAAVCLYVALVADAALDLIGARRALLVEGRFAEAEVIVRALASRRRERGVFAPPPPPGVPAGPRGRAARSRTPRGAPAGAAPREGDLPAYAALGAREAEGAGLAA